MVDPKEFFKEVTLRLCRHLEIEEGLHSCIEYLSEHMPADALYLERFDPDLDAMHVVARATGEGAEKLDVIVPLGEEARGGMDRARQAFRAGALPPVFVINRSDDEPVTRHLLAALGAPPSSAMSMPLIVEGRLLGTLALLAEGDHRFTEEHARLYAVLKEPFFVAMSNTLRHQEVVRLKDLLADDNRYLHKELLQLAGKEIVGRDFGLKPVMTLVQQVATLDSPVLLLGETGVGKDVVANAIHYSSPRRDGPFIKVNSGAIPETLVDSELFGHEKGAFSGALAQKRGRFERAHGGTIFLDEIGELPLQAQVRLLRVLQDKEIERVGGTQTITVDIRVIAATNRDLEQMVRAGTFRQDLWFRLNVFPVRIPPLRERKEDITALVVHFVERKAREMRLAAIPTLAPGAIDVLTAYDWPGNVRELQNVVERALILDPRGPLTFDSLVAMDRAPTASQPQGEVPADLGLDAVVTAHIRRVLDLTGGKVHGPGGAAEALGVNPSTLRSRMKKLGITAR